MKRFGFSFDGRPGWMTNSATGHAQANRVKRHAQRNFKSTRGKNKTKRTFYGIGRSPPGVFSNWDKTRMGIEILLPCADGDSYLDGGTGGKGVGY